MRLTDRSGKITPIAIPTPDISDSQAPGSTQIPFTLVDLTARLQGYEQIRAEDIQIFPNTTTYQELELIPLSELPDSWNQSETFGTPPQNL